MTDTSGNVNFFEFEDTFDFIENETDTYGMEVKFGRNNIGISLCSENKKIIKHLMITHGTEDPLKKDILYLKPKFLSVKQKEEILNKGPMIVKVKFQCTGALENEDDTVKYFVFKLLALKKESDDGKFIPQDDF